MSNYVLSRENKSYGVGSGEKTIAIVHGIKHGLKKFAEAWISLGETESEVFSKKEQWECWLW